MSLLENGVIHKDNDIALTYVILNGRKASVEETPSNHGQANAFPLLKRFKLSFTETEPGFKFCNGMQCSETSLIQ